MPEVKWQVVFGRTAVEFKKETKIKVYHFFVIYIFCQKAVKSQYLLLCLVSVIKRRIWSYRQLSSIYGSLSDIDEPRTDSILDVNLSKVS